MYMARWGNQQQRMANIQMAIEHAAPYQQHLLHGQKIIYLPWPFAGKDKVGEELKASRDALDLELMSAKTCCMKEDRLLYVAMTILHYTVI